MFAAGTIPGTILGGVLADKWGKKLTMCISNLLAYGFWLITAFANNKYLLLLSYTFQGFFGVIGLNLVGKYEFMIIGNKDQQHIFVGLYIAETAEASMRRKLGPFHSVFQCLGDLIGYTCGAFLHWRTCKLILGSLVTLPAALILLLFHETPHWLVGKGKLGEAK